MANGMDKSLMALMGIEDSSPSTDDGLVNQNTLDSQSQDMPSFFDNSNEEDEEEEEPMSDLDSDTFNLQAKPSPSKPSSNNVSSTYSMRIHEPGPRLPFSGSGTSDHDIISSPSPISKPPRASSSSLFARPSSPLDNPFERPSNSGMIRKQKASKKGKEKSAGPMDFMFSPTLGPRKTIRKQKSSPPPLMSTHAAPQEPTSVPSRDNPFVTQSPPLLPSNVAADGMRSPLSSFVLRSRRMDISGDSDSDISPFEEDDSTLGFPDQRNVYLNASFSLDTSLSTNLSISDAASACTSKSGSGSESATRIASLDHDDSSPSHSVSVAAAEDQEMQQVKERTPKPTQLSKKQQLEEIKERERLLRLGGTNLKPTVNKKLTLQDLMEETRAKQRLKQKQSKPRPTTVSLTDSEDEELDAKLEQEQWKLRISRTLLDMRMPKEKRVAISKKLDTSITPEQRLEVERSLQLTMSPLSSKIQHLSLLGGSPQKPKAPMFAALTASVQTSPTKSSTVTSVSEFNKRMKRKMAKQNLQHRRNLEQEARKVGTWKSPEDYAAEQLKNEENRNRGLDPDEEGNNVDGTAAARIPGDIDDEDNEEDQDYDPMAGFDEEERLVEPKKADANQSDDNEIPSGESGDDDSGNEQEGSGDDGEDEDEEDSDDVDSASEDDGMEDCEETRPVKVKRAVNRKKTVIDDDDVDVKIVLVDRSQAQAASESEKDASGESEAAGSGSGEDDDDNGDISDLDDDMDTGDGGTQGFGAFFESSYNPNRATNSMNDTEDKFGRVRTMPSISARSFTANASQDGDQDSGDLSGAIDFLSGGFLSATPARNELIPRTAGSQEFPDESSLIIEEDVEDLLGGQAYTPSLGGFIPSSSFLADGSRNAFDLLSRKPPVAKNSLEPVEQVGRRRLVKQQPKHVIAKGEKSAYIEYEAEEEEDEFMGMGGIDYESDNPDNDDYDLGDGMIDSSTNLDGRGVEDVRKLHMQHEQDQHNKEISDLVHGIAAGSLWKRRNGQMDDLDLFDEEDMDGRFRRKKKLKVSEKFEKLADNPATAAFARAFKKNVDDDQLVFLSDVDETDSEAESARKKNKNKHRKAERMGGTQGDLELLASGEGECIAINENDYEEEEEEEEDEVLNTDKRKARLREARLQQEGSLNQEDVQEESLVVGSIAAMTRAQVLPFGPSEVSSDVETLSVSSKSSVVIAPVDELKEALRRNMVIRSIMDGVDDPLMTVDPDDERQPLPSSQIQSSKSSFSIMDRIRINDASSVVEGLTTTNSSTTSGNTAGFANEAVVDVTAIARPRMLVRQSSSFLSEERRTQFLSTVGEESRGGNAGTRVVKEVNRRGMAFATSKTAPDTVSSSSLSSVSSSARGSSRSSAIKNTATRGLSASGTGSVGGQGANRLLKILSAREKDESL
ncbi:hypothetical protein BGZ83_006538 [Gryganskiella cystojenkinii]|nr:hypothetical protein BGZ83_006538 [Gryganskiella cystojenkinii]